MSSLDIALVNVALKFMINEVHDKDTAKRCLKAYVDVLQQDKGIDRDKAVEIAKSNLGYLAGYYDHATRLRVEALYNCVHPLLGPAGQNPPSFNECMKAGINWKNSCAENRQHEIHPQPKEDI